MGSMLGAVAMPLSSGTRNLLSEAVAWAAAGVGVAFVLANFDEISGLAGKALDRPDVQQALRLDRAGPAKPPAQPMPVAGEVHLRPDTRGHYHADVEINGRPVHSMVDTGATMVALSYEDARSAGIFISNAEFTHRVNTANGIARVAPVTLSEVRLGDIVIRDVQAAVAEPGRMSGTLLGMSFLGRLSRFEIRQGTLILQN